MRTVLGGGGGVCCVVFVLLASQPEANLCKHNNAGEGFGYYTRLARGTAAGFARRLQDALPRANAPVYGLICNARRRCNEYELQYFTLHDTLHVRMTDCMLRLAGFCAGCITINELC